MVASENWRLVKNMYAIIRTGGRQHKVVVGETVDVEKLPYEEGATVELSEVLLITNDSGELTLGKPLVSGAKVKATVLKQYRGKKILVWKYIPKERYRRRQGHRQSYTRLKIEAIEGI
jgi:large subunit ribosomal protein L21